MEHSKEILELDCPIETVCKRTTEMDVEQVFPQRGHSVHNCESPVVVIEYESRLGVQVVE
ncbi:MAG: hypothetical protein HXS41_03610 [Theionarchaea archaeon]|nr:hypothetical protein [Theionarchaea archaeon]MBU6999934.1 hypothetical protein [Theionarchaea archaeon]MBU7020124.1 hypothetical protein [Theionarchaea archaeon]MBU7035829.1 hypothetical protein [Theionarchaea archaeon]MBU7041418.1 hypothetical protein [Theionarchaea archaeon]